MTRGDSTKLESTVTGLLVKLSYSTGPDDVPVTRSSSNDSGKGKGISSARAVKNREETSKTEDAGEVGRRGQHGDPQLSFLGAIVAEKALRRFMAPHRGLFSKLNLRRFSRLSLSVDGTFRLPILLEPTYQLGPTKPFQLRRVQSILKEVVEGIIDRTFKRNANIDPGALAKNLSNDARLAVKSLAPPRSWMDNG
ncbi:hypothetical protein Aperf_G00000120191 [Anoplocephala perfoliata]